MENKWWYYYLHTNGDLISKPPAVVDSDPQYFDSDFVKAVWHIDLNNREDAWTLALEALAWGARIDRVKELADKWNLTFEDSIEMLKCMRPTGDRMKDGLKIFIEKILNMTEEEYWKKAEIEFNVMKVEGIGKNE